jgi:hypothetical protein
VPSVPRVKRPTNRTDARGGKVTVTSPSNQTSILARAMEKLGIRNRVGLIDFAIRQGWLIE